MAEPHAMYDLHDAARDLDVHPFEVVRLMVLSGGKLDGLVVPDGRLESLREFGGIETWWADATLPEDDNPRRRVVRALVDALLQRGLVGERSTRTDNLWRGLTGTDRETAERTVELLTELGMLTVRLTPKAAQVSVHPDARDTLRGLVSRGQAPPEIAALWTD